MVRTKKSILTYLYAVKFGNQGFGAPIAANHDNEVIMSFGAAVNDNTTLIGQTFHECAVFKVGIYNPILGKVKSINPVLVKRGIDIKLPEVKEETEFEKEISEFSAEVLETNRMEKIVGGKNGKVKK